MQRHLAQAITPGTALSTPARLRMRGHIKVGRWLPFRARQIPGRITSLVFDRWGDLNNTGTFAQHNSVASSPATALPVPDHSQRGPTRLVL